MITKTSNLFVIAVIIVLVSGLTFVLGYNYCRAQSSRVALSAPYQTDGIDTQTPPIIKPSQGALDTQAAFESISQAVKPAIVSIRSRMTVKQPALQSLEFGPSGRVFPFDFGTIPPTNEVVTGTGSGFIVRQDGYILTNDHVVAGADKVTIRLDDGREFTGAVKDDFRSDIALIKIPADHLPTLNLADSSKIKVGEWAIAFGTPFGLKDTMTVGVVSALSRETVIGDTEEDERFYPNLVQTDASINPGNSGGPLLDIYGRVIGINAAIDSPSGGNVGIGFAIPANTATYVMDQLISKGAVTRGFLGLVPQDLSSEDKTRYGVNTGVLISAISDGSPAAKAGLQVEDVITAFDGQPVSSESEFREKIARSAPDTQVNLDVVRDSQKIQITANLSAAPDETIRSIASDQGLQRGMQKGIQKSTQIGIQAADLTPDIAIQMGLDSSSEGVLVTNVQQGSSASDAGVIPGDLLIRINGVEVHSASQVNETIGRLKSGDTVSFVIKRKNSQILIQVPVY